MNATGQLRVLVVDDQRSYRDALGNLLRASGAIVVGLLQSADQIELAVAELRPDVLLMDVRMQPVDGVEATRRVKRLDSPPPVLILTTFDSDDVLYPAIEAGAAGFVLKTSPAADIVRATETVAAGQSWLDPEVTGRVLFAWRQDSFDAEARARVLMLTAREREVLGLISTGATNGELGQRLFVSERTVKSHVSAILRKTGARDRAALVILARQSGLQLGS